jgi:phage/plasmid primase-like uncharacterized protein
MKKLALSFVTLALALASAGTSYRVTLYQPAQVNGTTLKPGDYKVEVGDGTVSFKQGKISAEAKAKVEEGSQKILSTTVDVDGDTKQLKEIRLGGTNKVIVLEKTGAAAGN